MPLYGSSSAPTSRIDRLQFRPARSSTRATSNGSGRKNAAPEGTAFRRHSVELGLNGFDSGDLRNLLLENPLDAIGERELRHRTAAAGTLK